MIEKCFEAAHLSPKSITTNECVAAAAGLALPEAGASTDISETPAEADPDASHADAEEADSDADKAGASG